jgi:phosphate starvation-inducible protein PhoH
MAKLKKKQNVQQHFSLRNIQPMTVNQEKAFQEYDAGKNLMLHGAAGTGKTFISMYLALEEILRKNSYYNRIVVIRSVVPSRDMGFLPGNSKEKAKVYEEPYREICDDLFGRGDGYDILRMKNLVEFTTTSFLRGITFRDAIVIVDECQNLTGHECDTVITRVGDNSKIVFCGDFKQTDLQRRDREGFLQFSNVLHNLNNFTFIEFNVENIVHSGLVKEYIIEKDRMNIQFA